MWLGKDLFFSLILDHKVLVFRKWYGFSSGSISKVLQLGPGHCRVVTKLQK